MINDEQRMKNSMNKQKPFLFSTNMMIF